VARIFVAGPVGMGGGRSRYLDASSLEEVNKLYDALQAASAGDVDLVIPAPDDRLDKLEPREFVSETLGRIAKSDCAISVLVKGDRGGVIETVLISAMGRRQIVVSDDPDALPRATLGLPGVEGVATLEQVIQDAADLLSVSKEQASRASEPTVSLVRMAEAASSQSERAVEA
jgi:hypothetical protein